jgi:hypothetical protein
VKTTKTGKKVRLAFAGGEVVEAKNLKTGAVHTPGEFAEDEAACERGHCGENFGRKKR